MCEHSERPSFAVYSLFHYAALVLAQYAPRSDHQWNIPRFSGMRGHPLTLCRAIFRAGKKILMHIQVRIG